MLDLLTQIGGCVLYHDYRSGSFRDWSGAGNDGTASGSCGLIRGGARLGNTGTILVPASISLDFGSRDGFTIVLYFSDGVKPRPSGVTYLYQQAVTSDYFGMASGVPGAELLYLRVNGAVKSLSGQTVSEKKYLGVSWINGGYPGFYLDGVFSGAAAVIVTKRALPAANLSNIGTIAGGGVPVPARFSAVAMFDKALSATEHAQVYAALRAMKWPTKATGRGTNRIGVASDCVAGYNMRPVAGKVFDMSGNGNHGTILRGKSLNTVMGPALSFIDSDDLGVNCGSDASTNLTGAMTLSGWAFKPDITAQTYMIRRDNYGVSLAGAGAVNSVYFYTRNAADTGSDANALSVDFDPGNWVHFAAVFDPIAQTKVVYANGVAGTPVSKTDGGVPSSPASDLLLGTNGSATFPGVLRNVQIFNVAKDAAWVMSEYQQGARQVTFKTDWGARETLAAVGAPGPLTNTPWEVVSGTHEIITTTINGTLVKAIRCVTAGQVAIPASLFRVGEAGAARGGFKWWMYKFSTATQPRVNFIANQKTGPTDPGFNCYEILLTNDEEFTLWYRLGGSRTFMQITQSGYVAFDAWHKIEITVGDGGVFTTYFDDSIVDLAGGSGVNPVTDTNVLISRFFIWEPDAGDMLALGSVDGEYALEKILGVSNAR